MRNHVIHNIVNGWNVEAKLEDPKYFYFYKEVKSILNNRKCYVIGRKGTGKSAICQYITNLTEYNVFTTKLSFKSFPFNQIYELRDRDFTPSHQYITIWKYIIYSNLLKMMKHNNTVDQKVRSELEKLYPSGSVKQLAREISEWTSGEFGVDVLGCGGSLKLERTIRPREFQWQEYVETMEDIVREHCGNAKYYLVFDELDDDYKDITQTQQFKNYIELLTGLFKAVQDVKSIFPKEDGFNIMPVVLLRNDIYYHLKDNDKNKWNDMSIVLEWNKEKLKELLAFRIQQDDPIRSSSIDFKTEWERIFTSKPIRYGVEKKKRRHIYDFMADSTLLRPRDFIKYIKLCCEEVIDTDGLISTDVVHKVDRAFSNYLKQEFRDELQSIIPDIDKIFDIISYQRQWIFSPEAFKEAYVKELQLGNVQDKNVDAILETLYNFSVIGVENKNIKNTHYFKYINTNMSYNRYENIVVHRGLFKVLGIL